MKKILIRVGIGLLLLIILAVLGISFFLDGAVKRGVETVGPMLTKVPVKLDAVTLSLWSGSGKMKGLNIGNPEGYKTPQAILVGSASLSLKPASVFSDKVIINKIEVESPDVTFEMSGLRANNLSKILANLSESTGGKDTNAAAAKSEPGESKKLQVDDFVITGAKLHLSATLLGGQSYTATIPDIHLSKLGQGPEGITTAELTKLVLNELLSKAIEVAEKMIADSGKGATGLVNDAIKNPGGAASSAASSLLPVATRAARPPFRRPRPASPARPGRWCARNGARGCGTRRWLRRAPRRRSRATACR